MNSLGAAKGSAAQKAQPVDLALVWRLVLGLAAVALAFLLAWFGRA